MVGEERARAHADNSEPRSNCPQRLADCLPACLAITPALIGGLSYPVLSRCLRPRYYVSRERETTRRRSGGRWTTTSWMEGAGGVRRGTESQRGVRSLTEKGG